uniref:CCHC-type domain-containing protein n=1 Tax=Tanacetum cinerariifolium TaxID=118510 RepID=A0A6L2LZ53_TANCI|nr:hypothetical protein [Tanacetum cinerariifolium]
MAIGVEYEWTSPRCDSCKKIGHTYSQCPKHVPKPKVMTRDQKDGFTKVKRKGSKPRKFEGLSLSRKVEYRPVGKKQMTNEGLTSKNKSMEASTSRQPKTDANLVKMTNTFGVLSGMDEGEKGCEELISDVIGL